mgnify:CR=1 FL=1
MTVITDREAERANAVRVAAETVATRQDEDWAVETLTRAFAGDRCLRWMYPYPDQYRAHMPRFIRAFAGKAFEAGTAHQAGTGRGAALWLPPGVHPDPEPLEALIEDTVDVSMRGDLYALLGKMEAVHPQEPHWYLALLGVDPAFQRQGTGSVLLEFGLQACDAEGLPAYLEATSEDNARLYARHGFKTTATLQAGNSPVLYAMWRRPRR